MSAKLVARSTGVYPRCLVEVAPDRLLYEMQEPGGPPSSFVLPMPWLYVVINNSSGGFRPYAILGAHSPISGPADPLGVPPLLGLHPEGTMCTTPMRIPSVSYRAGDGEKLLAAVAGALASGGKFIYMIYLQTFKSFEFLARAAGVENSRFAPEDYSNKCRDLWNEIFLPTYHYWESLEEFPRDCPLAGKTIKDFGFDNRSLLKDPQILAD